MRDLLDLSRGIKFAGESIVKVHEKALCGPIDVANEFTNTTNDLINSLVEMPLKVRYGTVPEYKDFKRRIWDVRHPEDAMPPMEKWFGEDENDGLQEDEDIIIEREKQSLNCPITTNRLEEPFISNVCDHVFSKTAIMELINRSPNKEIKCPVPGCNKNLSAGVMQRDKLIERRLRALKEKEADITSGQLLAASQRPVIRVE